MSTTLLVFPKPVAVQVVNALNKRFRCAYVSERAFLENDKTVSVEGSIAGIVVDIVDGQLEEHNGVYAEV